MTVYKKARDNLVEQVLQMMTSLSGWEDELEDVGQDAIDALEAVLDELEDIDVE